MRAYTRVHVSELLVQVRHALSLGGAIQRFTVISTRSSKTRYTWNPRRLATGELE
jgi:hypothetical protein